MSSTPNQPYEVNRRVIDGKSQVTENNLAPKELRPSVNRQDMNKEIVYNQEKAIINQRKVDKYIDIYVEKPVPNYIEKDVYYDVIVEKPREIITERDVITEIYVEKPVEKIVDVPVQKIVEVPIKKTIERPVYVDVMVDMPYETIVHKTVQSEVPNNIVRNNVVECDEKDVKNMKYDQVLPTEVRVYEKEVVKEQKMLIQNFIEKNVETIREEIVNKPVPRHIDRPVNKFIEKPYYTENKIEKIVEVPVEQIRYNKVVQIEEVPQYIENKIEKPVYYEKIVEVPKDVIEERIVEKNVYHEKIVRKTVDRIIEKPVPIEREVKVEVPVYVDVPFYTENIIKRMVPKIVHQEVIYENVTPVEKVNVIEEIIEVPIERIIERPIDKVIERQEEVIVEKEVYEDNLIEDIQYVDKIVKVNVERKIERPVMKDVVTEKEVFVDKIIVKEVQNKIEKIIENPVEKIVEVPVDIIVDRPVFVPKNTQKDVYVDKNVNKSNTEFTKISENPALVAEYERQKKNLQDAQIRLARKQHELDALRKPNSAPVKADIDYTSQNELLKRKIDELKRAITDIKERGIIRKSLIGNQDQY